MNIVQFHHKTDIVKRRFRRLFYSWVMRMKYSFYPNMKYGNKVIFDGLSKFRNYPGGKITVGNRCSFLSIATSNMIGINRPCMITTQTSDAKIIIGDNCGFSGTVIGAFVSITLGNNVRCGANTLITDSDWHTDDPRSGEPRPVKINDNVWLGEGAKILKGVSIGENSVIGAGSIVVRDIPANVIAAGNPCKVIKEIDF